MRGSTGLLLALALGAGAADASGFDCLPPATAGAGDLLVAAPEMRAAPVRAVGCTTAAEVLALARRAAATPPPVAASAPAVAAKPAAPPASGGYVPKTPHDNTPWRFDMQQNGKRMSAEEFDAWMKAKGIRVATGKPAAGTGEPAPAPASGSSQPR